MNKTMSQCVSTEHYLSEKAKNATETNEGFCFLANNVRIPTRLANYVLEWCKRDNYTEISERFGKNAVCLLTTREFYNLFHNIVTEDSTLLLKENKKS